MSQVVENIRLYKNHGFSIGYWQGTVFDTGELSIEHAKKLDGNPVRMLYLAEPKNVGKANETTSVEQAVSELRSRAKKKLDKGYVDSLEKAEAPSTNALGLLAPMLATPIEKVKPEKIDWENAYAQPKLDGHRCLYVDGVLYSRTGKELDLPHIKEAVLQTPLRDLHLDGELYIHGRPLQDISSLVKKNQFETDLLEFHVYDCIEAASYIERVKLMSDAVSMMELPDAIKPVQTLKVSNLEDLMSYHTYWRNQGYEGSMLRHGDSHYQDGKRSRSLLKVKEFHDAEFTVVAVTPGKEVTLNDNTYIPAVYTCITEKGKEFNVTAPGTAQEKHFQYVMRRDYLGRQLTVKYHYLSKDGVPQLPIALRFREDI